MPTLSYVFLCLTLLTLPISSWAQAPDKIPQPDYSQEAAVIEDSTYKIKFANDGTSTQEQSARVRVQSDAGVQRVGLLTFSYESGIASFEVVCVRVHKPDGTIIDTPPDSIQDMPSEVTRQAPFYSDIREKHVAVKGLSIGDTLEYKTVTHVTKPLAPGQFWFDYNFTHDAIVLKEQLEVTVPRDRAIKWRSPDAKPTITDSGNDRVYSWNTSSLLHLNKGEKIEQAKLNWEQSRSRCPHPDVQLTSFQSWDEVGRWYRDLQADRVKPSPEIIAKAAELAKGAADDEAKLRAIYNYVSLQFRYIGVAFGVGRYQPHFASEVLANQYGDCKDKHTLLAALLSASGIQAVPALISSERDIDPEIPSPAQFNHVITAIPRGDSLLWLDTTSEVAPYQFLLGPLRDKSALVIWNDKPAGLVTTSAKLPFPSAQNFQMDAKLDDTGTLTGHAEFSLRGDLEILLRAAYRSTPMPQWKDLTQRISQSLGFAGEVSDVTASSPEKTDEPFRITYKYVRKDFGDWPNHRVLAPSGVDRLFGDFYGDQRGLIGQRQFDTIGVEDEEMATRLASSWAVLGFIYQRLGKSDDAENYQLASWKLTQNGVAAAHLCQFYLDQHKAPSALQMCQFARNRLPAANDPLLYRTGTLLKENDARLEKLSPGSSNAINMKIVDHVLAMRDFKLPRVFTGTATADFYVLLEYNQQIGHFEVIDTRYIHGSEKLKSAGTALTKLNLNFVSPDGNSVRVLRRGTIVCGDTTICEFMLADATSGHSVPIPFKVVN